MFKWNKEQSKEFRAFRFSLLSSNISFSLYSEFDKKKKGRKKILPPKGPQEKRKREKERERDNKCDHFFVNSLHRTPNKQKSEINSSGFVSFACCFPSIFFFSSERHCLKQTTTHGQHWNDGFAPETGYFDVADSVDRHVDCLSTNIQRSWITRRTDLDVSEIYLLCLFAFETFRGEKRNEIYVHCTYSFVRAFDANNKKLCKLFRKWNEQISLSTDTYSALHVVGIRRRST